MSQFAHVGRSAHSSSNRASSRLPTLTSSRILAISPGPALACFDLRWGRTRPRAASEVLRISPKNVPPSRSALISWSRLRLRADGRARDRYRSSTSVRAVCCCCSFLASEATSMRRRWSASVGTPRSARSRLADAPCRSRRRQAWASSAPSGLPVAALAARRSLPSSVSLAMRRVARCRSWARKLALAGSCWVAASAMASATSSTSVPVSVSSRGSGSRRRATASATSRSATERAVTAVSPMHLLCALVALSDGHRSSRNVVRGPEPTHARESRPPAAGWRAGLIPRCPSKSWSRASLQHGWTHHRARCRRSSAPGPVRPGR